MVHVSFLSGGFRQDAADGQVIERSDRTGLRPQTDSPGCEPRIAVIEVPRAVEPRLDAVAHGHDAHGVPAPERGRLDRRGGELAPPSVEVVEGEVVLERVGTDDVVLAGAGTTVKTYTGRKIPTAAATAPRKPATRNPMNTTVITTGPGVIIAIATASRN
jgi:hypothetical protein